MVIIHKNRKYIQFYLLFGGTWCILLLRYVNWILSASVVMSAFLCACRLHFGGASLATHYSLSPLVRFLYLLQNTSVWHILVWPSFRPSACIQWMCRFLCFDAQAYCWACVDRRGSSLYWDSSFGLCLFCALLCANCFVAVRLS